MSARLEYLPGADAIARAESKLSNSELEEIWGSSWSRLFPKQSVILKSGVKFSASI
jgi:hypothetical protein